MAIKLEGGDKALVARALVDELFFCGFPKGKQIFFLPSLPPLSCTFLCESPYLYFLAF